MILCISTVKPIIAFDRSTVNDYIFSALFPLYFFSPFSSTFSIRFDVQCNLDFTSSCLHVSILSHFFPPLFTMAHVISIFDLRQHSKWSSFAVAIASSFCHFYIGYGLLPARERYMMLILFFFLSRSFCVSISCRCSLLPLINNIMEWWRWTLMALWLWAPIDSHTCTRCECLLVKNFRFQIELVHIFFFSLSLLLTSSCVFISRNRFGIVHVCSMQAYRIANRLCFHWTTIKSTWIGWTINAFLWLNENGYTVPKNTA